MDGQRNIPDAEAEQAPRGRATRRRGLGLALGAFVVALASWFVPTTQMAAAVDVTPPSAPRDLSVVVNGDGSLTASWSASVDNVGVARYVVSRNNVEVLDDVTGLSATVDLGVGDHWIQVRAVDASGNVGVKTWPVHVKVEADTVPPSAPRDLSVVVNGDGSLTASWSASVDNVGVARYVVSRNNVEVLDDVTGLSATVDLGVGDHWIQVRAVDASGNVGVKTWPVHVKVEADTVPPSAPRDLSVVVNGDGSLTASWSASVDNVGVARYVVSRNNVEVLDDVTGLSATVDLGVGDHWIQVRAVDASGNVGVKTWPVHVKVEADTVPPSAPRDLSVVVNGDGSLTASWSASVDNVGVARYVVSRNNVEVLDDVTGLSATVDLGVGDHWIQVRAVDASGNVGVKTWPVKVTVQGDTSAPSTPGDLAVAVAGELELMATWSASSDDVGVAAYEVFCNGERVDPQMTITATEHRFAVDSLVGPHVVHVRAVDAAGNSSGASDPVQYGDGPDAPGDEPDDGPDVEPNGAEWDPMRVRDEAGAVLPYSLDPADLPATIVVDAAGSGDHTSIRAAISVAGSNDVIEVRSGEYRESIGVVNKHITVRAADGAHPVVLGTERVEPGALAGGGDVRSVQLWASNPLKSLDSGLNEGSYFYSGLVDLGDPSSSADLLPEQVFWVDGNGVWHEVAQRRHGVSLAAGTFSYDPNSKSFTIHLADWSAVDHLEVTTRREGLRLLGGADGSTVSGLEFRAFSPPTDGDGWATVATNGNHSDRLSDVELRDIVVTDSASNGISAYYATDLTLIRLTADRNVIKGFNSGRVLGMRLEFSRFNENNKDHLRDIYSMLAGAKITGSTGDDPGSVIRYNSFADNQATGYWCDLWCENDTIVGNYAGDNAKHGLYYEVSEDAVIASNLLVRNGAAGVKVSGSQRVDIVRNTFVGNAQHIHLGTDTRPRTGPGDGNRRPGHPVVTDTAEIWIDGNVFAEEPGAARSLIYRVGGADGAGLRNLPSERLDSYEQNAHSLNTFDDGGRRRFEWDFGQTWQTPADFLANSGTGTSEVTVRTADPLDVFVDAAGGDWRLADGSTLGSYQHSQPLPASAVAEMLGTGTASSPVGAVLD